MNLKKIIQPIGLWGSCLFGWYFILLNIFTLAVFGVTDGMSFIGMITLAMLSDLFTSNPIHYIVIGFVGGTFVPGVMKRIKELA